MSLTLTQVRLGIPPPGVCKHYWAHQEAMRLFSADPDSPRDFLYRVDGPSLVALAPRLPLAVSDVMSSEAFEPPLDGERRFRLRCNPTVTKFINGKNRRCDPAYGVLDADRQREIYFEWLQRQGERHGFKPGHSVSVQRDRWEVRDGGRTMAILVVDFSGTLAVIDAAMFRAAVTHGIGHGKAWGLGLLLLC
jgi:CRISPR system Cascade subunit CasE